jgi:hypothetical protein
VRLAEAPSFGKPILLYDVQSVGAKSYLAVGQELLRRVEGENAPVIPATVVLPAESPQPADEMESTETAAAELQELEPHAAAVPGETKGSEATVLGAATEETTGLGDDGRPAGPVGDDGRPAEPEPNVAQEVESETATPPPSSHNPDTPEQSPDISELDDQGRPPKPSSEPLPEVTT